MEVEIFCVSRDERPNHPPIILYSPTPPFTQPVTMAAGQEYILHTPSFAVEDPDGDEIYASCNIGTCGRDPAGNFMWIFQSNFPGTYTVEILFFDIRGGEGIMKFTVEVKPWWEYPEGFLP